MVVHDTQYDAAAYGPKVGWGQSTMEYAVGVASAAEARRLFLFHHDPQRGDDVVDDQLARARALAAADGGTLEVDAAAEGAVVEVRGDRAPRVWSAGPAATVALALADGSRVGTLCVVDHRPRLLDERQLDELCRLAELVVAELEART